MPADELRTRDPWDHSADRPPPSGRAKPRAGWRAERPGAATRPGGPQAPTSEGIYISELLNPSRGRRLYMRRLLLVVLAAFAVAALSVSAATGKNGPSKNGPSKKNGHGVSCVLHSKLTA